MKPKRNIRKAIREERGDVSTKVLHRTIVVCAIALVGVLSFAFSPRQKPVTAASAKSQAQPKAAVTSFDRQSLSTKSR